MSAPSRLETPMTLCRTFTSSTLLALSLVVCAGVSLPGCGDKGGYRGGKKTKMRQWLDDPSSGQKEGNFIKFPQLDLVFEIPDTLYVFKNCAEASHSPEGDEKWVPIITCASTGAAADPDGVGEAPADSDAIALTFYLAPKGRPIDERAVAYYNNAYQESGLKVEELAFNDDYFYKTGIFAKLQVMDDSGTNAVREIQQFMWPVKDVVFVARMEYPFGDSRAIQQDWKAIMPYFKTAADDVPK
jgi:hypothetical protein